MCKDLKRTFFGLWELCHRFLLWKGQMRVCRTSWNRPGLDNPNFSTKAFQNVQKHSWQDQLNYERKYAYRKWISIVSSNPMAFEVARQQILSGPMEFAKGGLAESIGDSLGNKSSSTLHSRASPLLRFLKFCADRDLRAFPLEEYRVYDYVKSVADTAPSYPRSFMLSISFVTHVLGLLGGLEVCSSKRIDGAVKLHYEKRTKVRQRPPLIADQIKTLERVVTNSNKSVYDRIMAGYFLMLLYGRLTFSDGQRIIGMRLELVHVDSKPVGFLEYSAERTKTSISLERKVRYLPIAIPVQCLTEPAWLPVWDKLRAEQGWWYLENRVEISLLCLLQQLVVVGLKLSWTWHQQVSGCGIFWRTPRLLVTSGLQLTAAKQPFWHGAPVRVLTMTSGDCLGITVGQPINLCWCTHVLPFPIHSGFLWISSARWPVAALTLISRGQACLPVRQVLCKMLGTTLIHQAAARKMRMTEMYMRKNRRSNRLLVLGNRNMLSPTLCRYMSAMPLHVVCTRSWTKLEPTWLVAGQCLPVWNARRATEIPPPLCGTLLQRPSHMRKRLHDLESRTWTFCVISKFWIGNRWQVEVCVFFPSNAFMASARSFNMFKSMLQLGWID